MQQARLPWSGGFMMENDSDAAMAALICCNSVPYHWYRHTGVGTGQTWSACIINGVCNIIYAFHATRTRLPLRCGFIMENDSDVYMSAHIYCNSIPNDWYGHTCTG